MTRHTASQTYSRLIGFVFLFNLILGTGALALPRAFNDAGWLVTGILLASIAFMSYVPATFIIETMAVYNAIHSVRKSVSGGVDEDEQPLANTIRAESFEINVKYELGELFRNLVGKAWTSFFYITISLYIYGDLSIYAAAVSKSLRDVTCNVSIGTLNETDPCWSSRGMSRITVYRIYLVIFACVLGPFFFFNLAKTRWLQVSTTIARWVAIILMSSIAIARIIEFPEVPRLDRYQMPTFMSLLGTPNRPNPPIANWANLPKAFGVCIYAFMCHHSLPGVITPVEDKRYLFSSIMLPAYVVIYICYIFLCGTAIAAFDYIYDLYTLNFVPSNDPVLRPGSLLLIIEYFLALYPVFALSSNFPIMGTTLTNNLIALLLALLPAGRRIGLIIRWGVPFLALIPPILVALIVNDVGQLVSMTGAFGGVFLMYIFPGVLVFYARKALRTKFELHTDDYLTMCTINPYRSPFSHPAWLLVAGVWAISCLIVVILSKCGVM